MKVFFLLLVVGLLWGNNNALRCVNNRDPIPFNASNLTEVKELINNLDTAEGYQVCSIQYVVWYPQKEFAVLFDVNIDQFPGTINKDVLLDVKLKMASNGSVIDPASGQKFLVFTCNDEDACERQLWHNHIDLFVEEKSATLEEGFRSVLITENQEKVECAFDNGTHEGTCSGDACFIGRSFINPPIFMRVCAEKDLRETSVELAVIVRFSPDNSTVGLSMEALYVYYIYTCQFNNCNDEETESKFRDTITYQTIDSSSIYQAFITRLQEKKTTKPNSGSSSTRSESPDISTSTSPQTTPSISTSTFRQTTPNTSILHLMSMNILILHILFLIFF